jgi:ribosomal protein S18 acetylase RimI-like enzyme
MVILNQLTADKFDEFYKVFEQIMREGYSGFSPTLVNHFLQNDYSKFTFSFWLEKNFRRFSLAIENNKIVGFLIGDHTYGGVAFISWVAVIPEYRKKGIGKMLLQDYEQYVRSKKAHLIELFTYDNVLPFYLENGFKEIGRRQMGFYGQPNIIMNKQIGEWKDSNLIKLEI